MPIRDVGEIEHAIEVFARAGNGGLMVLPDVSSTNYRDLIIAARSSHRVHQFRLQPLAADGKLDAHLQPGYGAVRAFVLATSRRGRSCL